MEMEPDKYRYRFRKQVIAGPVTVSEISGDHAWHRQKGLYFLSGPNKMRPKRLGQRIQCLSCLTKSGLRAGTHKINVVEKHSKSHTLTVLLLLLVSQEVPICPSS